MKKRKVNKMVAWILIFAMGLVNISTLTNSYADEGEIPFVITDTTFADNNATVTWNYTYKPDGITNFNLNTDLELENDGELTDLLSEENKRIGDYKVKSDGKIEVNINKELIEVTIIPVDNSGTTTDGSISAEPIVSLQFSGNFKVPGAIKKQTPSSEFGARGDELPSGSKDVKSILTNLMVNVTQNGTPISENGTLTTEPIKVAVSFGCPVMGDDLLPPNVVNYGDYASFIIEGFSLSSGLSSKVLMFGEKKLGTLNILPHGVDDKSVEFRVTFDGDEDIFNTKEWSNVLGDFDANLKYVGNEQGTETVDYTVIILGKTFTVRVPEITKAFEIDKTGEKEGAQINWKVNVKATQGTDNLDISGYKLLDNLTPVGDLIGTFSYKGSSDSEPKPFDSGNITIDANGYNLTFPAGTVAPIDVSYSTKIADDFVTNGTKTITNTAALYNGINKLDEDSEEVSFDNKWIEKKAGTTIYEPALNEQVVFPQKRVAYIEWFITVNHMGANLQNAKIIDELSDKLSFVEAQWYTKNGLDWDALPDTVVPVNNEYKYPEVSLNKSVRLRIKTKVNEDQNIGYIEKTITNNATLKWDGGPGEGIGSGDTGKVGINSISKSAGNYDKQTHTIPWTVTVEKSDASIDLRVVDLLVYGTDINNVFTNMNNIEKTSGNGTGLESIGIEDFNAIKDSLIPSFRQKYGGGFTGSLGLTHTVYALKDSGGKTLADLIVASEGDSTIDVSGGDKSFGFKTIVTDPTYYLSNSNNTIFNTAMLFSGTQKINERKAEKEINPRTIKKDMLKAADGVDPLANKTQGTKIAAEGFNYQDKSVVFRLFVNQNGVNATGGITTTDGAVVGDITVKDVLPTGWEFVPIASGTDFYLFEASGNADSMVVGNKIDSYGGILSSDLTTTVGTATFTFTKLEEPYVIFVKARPTLATQNNYFDNNENTTVTNKMSFKSTQHTTALNSQQDVKITSQILDKNMANLGNGVLKWTVNYRPYDIFPNVKILDQYRLIDTLPTGLEVYTLANGDLDFSDGNFSVTETELTPTGYQPTGTIFTEQQLLNSVSYDNSGRKLIFTIPDKQKSYRFDYKTMVTATSGTLTNSVNLEGGNLTVTNMSKNYSVASTDASATMTRNGWIEIEKVNQNGAKLSGSTFTIFTFDKSRALRIGATDAQGKLILRGLPQGKYILKETIAPTNYTVSTREYIINVDKVSGLLVASIDNQTGDNRNKIKVTNYLEGTSGNLTVSKKVSGNDGDVNKDFNFSLSFVGLSGQKDFTKTDSSGNISYGSINFISGEAGTVVANFSLKHNETITIKGLPKDLSYILSEVDYSSDGYETTFVSNNDSFIEERSYEGIVPQDSTDAIAFTNTKNTYGDLLLSKMVTGNAGDLNKLFTFLLKFENPSTGSYSYEGLGGKEDGTLILDADGKSSITLKHGESIRIKDLPKGLNYTIEEQIDIEAIYDVSVNEVTKNKVTGTIENSDDKDIQFKNSKSTFGNLVIRKTVNGILGEIDRVFNFTLQMGALEVKTYEFELINSDNVVINSGNIIFDDNHKAVFSLKHGESIKIKGLPNKVTYSILEESVQGYVTSTSGNENGLIVGLSTPEVVFTNNRSTHGTLEVEKVVTGNGGDKLKEFSFILTVQDLPDGIYPATIINNTSEISRNINLDFIGGKTNFKLKHDEKLTINLPKDLSYAVTEENYNSAGYSTQISENNLGEVIVNEVLNVIFTNNRQVSGGGGGGGGTTPPTTPPVTPPTTPPTTPPVTPPTPPVTPPKVTTPEDVPVQGEVDVPDNEVPRVGVPPENGTVTVDEDGKWIYTPDPDFVGEDSFTIIVGDEEIVIDIDVEEVPLGTVTPPQEDLGDDTPTGVPSLPKTGGMSSLYLYIAGSIFVLIGLLSKKKNML